MIRLRVVCITLAFVCGQTVFCLAAGESVYTVKEALLSTKNGKRIGELSLSIEVKSLQTNTKTLYLVIGAKGGEIIEGGKNKSLWIFKQNTNASQLIKNLKRDLYELDVKNYRDFTPFSENGIRFELKECEEIKKQTKILFYTDAPLGKEVTLSLRFYIASKDKKRTTIDDDAKLSLVFTMPANLQENALIDLSGNEAKESLSEELSKKEKEEERIKRTNDLNIFITTKNKEISSLVEEITLLLSTKGAKVTEQKIDSIELVINEMQKRVEYWDKGYTDILLNEEALQDKFLKFGTDKIVATKKLGELRQKQQDQGNWLKKIGIGLGAVMAGWILFMQIWNPIKIKRQIRKQQKQMEQEIRAKAFEKIDINDLDKI